MVLNRILKNTNGLRKKTLQNIRKTFYENSPLCRECGTFTIYPEQEDNGASKPNTATIQHIYPRYHSEYDTNLELWCYACNEKDAFIKNQFKIYSREEMLFEILSKASKKFIQLNGTYLIDGVALTYKKHKLIASKDIIEFKFECLVKYMNDFIDNIFSDNKITFEEFFRKQINGEFSFKKHYIGDGWYQKEIWKKELDIYLNKHK